MNGYIPPLALIFLHGVDSEFFTLYILLLDCLTPQIVITLIRNVDNYLPLDMAQHRRIMNTHLQRNENLKPRETQDSVYLHEVVQENLYECRLYVLQA